MADTIKFIAVRDSVDERHANVIKAAQAGVSGMKIVEPNQDLGIYIQLYIKMPVTGLKSTESEIIKRVNVVSEFYKKSFNLKEIDRLVGAGMVLMQGSTDQINKACNINLIFAESEHSPLFGHLEDYGIPVDVADLVYFIAGLNSLVNLEDLVDIESSKKPSENQPDKTSGAPPCPNEEQLPHALKSVDYARLYNYPEKYKGVKLDGQGVTYTIIELGGSWEQAKPSIDRYFKNVGVEFPSVKVIQQPGYVPGNPNMAYQSEIAMNLEVPGHLLPKASFQMYFCNNDLSGLLWTMTNILHGSDPLPSVISLSWAFDEPGIPDQVMIHLNDVITEAVRTKGIPFITASGDYGSTFYTHTVPPSDRIKLAAAYPASHPDITAAGATKITLESSGKKIKEEVVFNEIIEIFNLPPMSVAAGGSFSKLFPIAHFQKHYITNYLNKNYPDSQEYDKHCWSADVSIACNSNWGGYYTVSEMFGECCFLIGTSGSACMWASLLARISQALNKSLGPVNDAMYYFGKQKENPFNEVKTGGNCLQDKDVIRKFKDKWRGTKSWDPGSGLGSPDGQKLLKCFEDFLS